MDWNWKMLNFSMLSTSGVKYLILRTTRRCNAKCDYCLNHYYQSGNQGRELTIGEIERLAKNIPELILLNLSGGEPFLRKDLDAVTEVFRKHTGVKIISIATNGSLPDQTTAFIKSVLGRHRNVILKIAISIDHIGDMHDRIRKIPDGYDLAVECAKGVKLLKRSFPDLVLHSNTTVSRDNVNDLDFIIDHLSEMMLFDETNITLVRAPLFCKDPARQDPVSPDLDMFVNTYQKIICNSPRATLQDKVFLSIKKLMLEHLSKSAWPGSYTSFRCPAGKNMFNVDEMGNLCLCEDYKDSELGNLRDFDFSIKKALADEKILQKARKIHNEKCHCHWECAILGSLLFSHSGRWSIFKKLFV